MKNKLVSRKRSQTGEMTLLEKALGMNVRLPITHGIGNEHYELAIAWMQGLVTISQAGRALGLVSEDELGIIKIDNSLVVNRMAVWFREAVKRGIVKIK